MKYFTQTLATAAALLLSCNAFAAKHDVDCPPVNTILANSSFVEAAQGTDNIWGMLSNDFNYNGADWNVIFAAKLPNATSAQEALDQGQIYFKQNVTLQEPMGETEDGINVCLYGYSEEYLVGAISPPIHLPSNAFSFVKRFKH